MSPWRRFLLGCAGVDRRVLAMCPTETEKLTGLGATVLVASGLAVVSGSVAFATAAAGGSPPLGVWAACVPLGLVYGAIVFTLDRFMVSQPLNPATVHPDQRPNRLTEVARTVAGAVPRLVLAVVMGFLVAEPLLLVAFGPEVDARLKQVQTEHAAQARTEIDTFYDDELARIVGRETELTTTSPELTTAVQDLAATDEQITTTETELAALEVTLRSEIAGVDFDGQTTGETGDGPVAEQIRAEIDLAQARLEGLQTQRDRQTSRLEDLDTGPATAATDAQAELDELAAQRLALADDRAADRADADQQAASLDGLLVRVEALESLTHDEQGGLTTVGATVWLVRAWLLIIDAMPIGFKVVMSLRRHRPYDTLVAAHQQSELASAAGIARHIVHRIPAHARQIEPADPNPATKPVPPLAALSERTGTVRSLTGGELASFHRRNGTSTGGRRSPAQLALTAHRPNNTNTTGDEQ